jgi:hypothetical protein
MTLVLFIFALMMIFMLVRTVVLESILQNAVSNMAKEVSAYSYVLSRTGLISPVDTSSIDDAYASGEEAVQAAQEAVARYNGTGDQSESEEGLSFSRFGDILTNLIGGGETDTAVNTFFQTLASMDWREAGTSLLRKTVSEVIKMGLNAGLNNLYYPKQFTKHYIPVPEDQFYRVFRVDEGSVDFSYSRFMPTDDNNSISVIVTCKVKPMFNFLPISDMTLTKMAVTAAWVTVNASE